MDSRRFVDPELLPLLDLFPTGRFSPQTLAQTRTDFAATLAAATADAPEIPGVTHSEQRVPGPDGASDVRVLVYVPEDAPRPLPALLWIHGGGHVVGVAEQSGPTVRRIAAEVGCAVISVDYRLSPETPFPGQLDDCYAALAWLHGAGDDLGIDPGRIAVGGDSAGGGLAAGLALLDRDRGEVALAYQLLIYPMLDDRTGLTIEPAATCGEFVWNRDANRFGWGAFLGREPGSEEVSPYAAPARAESLAGLPPAFIGVGDLDLFVEEDIAYARRLIHAGVPTELHVYPGAIHGFYNVPGAGVADAATRDYLDALRRAVRRG